MSDWQVGDLALCVDDAPCPTFGPAPLRAGATYHVVGVVPANIGRCGSCPACCGLYLDEVDCAALHGFAGHRFRKIRPDKRESCEPEFITLLKRTKRTVKA